MGITDIIRDLNRITSKSLDRTINCEYKQFGYDICLYTLEASYVNCPYIDTKGKCHYNSNVTIDLKYNEDTRFREIINGK